MTLGEWTPWIIESVRGLINERPNTKMWGKCWYCRYISRYLTDIKVDNPIRNTRALCDFPVPCLPGQIGVWSWIVKWPYRREEMNSCPWHCSEGGLSSPTWLLISVIVPYNNITLTDNRPSPSYFLTLILSSRIEPLAFDVWMPEMKTISGLWSIRIHSSQNIEEFRDVASTTKPGGAERASHQLD